MSLSTADDAKSFPTTGWGCFTPAGPLKEYKFNYAALTDTEVLVNVTHCGVCFSDIHLMNGDWGEKPTEEKPYVCGHEAVGKIIEIGANVTHLAVGDQVGIGWVRSTCPGSNCDECTDKSCDDQLCAAKVTTCAGGQKGGFADKIKVSSSWAFKIPETLPPQFAAPLMCAGITTYSPIEKYTSAGDSVGVLSIGGLGALAVQWANALNCNVTAISRGTDKKELATKLGAKTFLDSKDPEQLKAQANTLNFLIVCGPFDAKWSDYLNLLKPNGKICFVAVPPSTLDIHVGSMLAKQLSVVVSTVGGRSVTKRMLQFAADHKIYPMIEEFAFDDINTALTKVKANEVHFRAVLIADKK